MATSSLALLGAFLASVNGACPPATGTSSPNKPTTSTGYEKYGLCWYLTDPESTCDGVCSGVAGGSNMVTSAKAAHSWSHGDKTVIELFYQNGNPAGWTGSASGSWDGFGYAYKGSSYYGYSAGENSAAFPGNTRGSESGGTRQFVCACALHLDAPPPSPPFLPASPSPSLAPCDSKCAKKAKGRAKKWNKLCQKRTDLCGSCCECMGNCPSPPPAVPQCKTNECAKLFKKARGKTKKVQDVCNNVKAECAICDECCGVSHSCEAPPPSPPAVCDSSCSAKNARAWKKVCRKKKECAVCCECGGPCETSSSPPSL